MAKPRIGVLGTGDVGQVLGKGFADLGHEVKIGSREPQSERVTAWVKQAGPQASAGTFAQTAAFGEILVLATRWDGTENAIRLADPKNFVGKVVMDTTNPLIFEAVNSPRLALGHTDSAGEQIQRWLPGAKVVKVFNTVGNPHMVKPKFPGGPPDMFICGNNAEAKKTVASLCQAFGWPTIDIGGIEGARYLESLAMIWILHYFQTGTGNHAFKLLKK